MSEKLVPELRFPEYEGAWVSSQLGQCATFSKGKGISKSDIVEDGVTPCIRYGELYTTYSTRIDEPVSATNAPTHELHLSQGGEVIVPASGETAEDIATAASVPIPGIALGGDLNVIRGRFNSDFLANMLSAKRRLDLAVLAQGNSVVHIYAAQLAILRVNFPSEDEQRKIASFLDIVSRKITLLTEKKSVLEDYKRGVMQRLFSRALRFSRDDGASFPDWEERRLSEVLFEHKEKNDGGWPVYSVAVRAGLVDQIDHLGRSFAAKNTSQYNRVNCSDVVYTKSPTGDFPLGIIKQSRVEKPVAVSPLYGVYRPETPALGYILHVYFEGSIATKNYLHPLVQKGAKNTIAVTNRRFLEGKLTLPVDPDEQRKIADFLSTIDATIEAVSAQTTEMETFKKSLLQKMFV